MKKIEMNVTRCGSDGWHSDGTEVFWRASRWIKVKQNYNPCNRNSLWDYVTDGYGYSPYQDKFNPETGLFLDYFIYRGRTYAIGQFLALNNPFFCPSGYSYEDEDGHVNFLSGVDGDNYYSPIYIEMDECGEYVRVYERD